MSYCNKCPENSVSNKERLKCLCKEIYFMNNNLCEECKNLDYYKKSD